MTNTQNPFKLERFGNIKSSQASEFDLKYHATTHEDKRQRIVATILLDLYLMAAIDLIPTGTAIKLQRAVAQDLGGAKEATTEAAHCTPRQVMLGTETPQAILQSVLPHRAPVVDAFFAETDHLPANFNQSNLRAEENGLREGFRFACQTAVFAGQRSGALKYANVSVAVKNAYAMYETRVHTAFQLSLKQLNDKFQFRLPPKEDKKWREQIEIIRIYAQTLLKSTGAGEVLNTHHVEKLIDVYKAGERQDFI